MSWYSHFAVFSTAVHDLHNLTPCCSQ